MSRMTSRVLIYSKLLKLYFKWIVIATAMWSCLLRPVALPSARFEPLRYVRR